MTTDNTTLHELEQNRQDDIPNRNMDGEYLVERITNDKLYVIADENGNKYEGLLEAVGDINEAEASLERRLLPFSIRTNRLGDVEIGYSTRFYHDDLEIHLSLDTVSVDVEGRLSITFQVIEDVTPPFRSFKYDTETLSRELEAGTLLTPTEIDVSIRETLGIKA